MKARCIVIGITLGLTAVLAVVAWVLRPAYPMMAERVAKRLNPTSWQLGKMQVGRHALKDGKGFMWCFHGEPNGLIIMQREQPIDGSPFAAYRPNPMPYVYFRPSGEVLPADRLPESFRQALADAQAVANEALATQRWPMKLARLKRIVRNIAEGKVKLWGGGPTAAYVSSASECFIGEERIYTLRGAGPGGALPVRVNIWPHRFVLSPFGSQFVIVGDDSGLTGHCAVDSDESAIPSRIERTRETVKGALMALTAARSPDPAMVDGLKRVAERLENEEVRPGAQLDTLDLMNLLRPHQYTGWTQERWKEIQKMRFARVGPLNINGVEVELSSSTARISAEETSIVFHRTSPSTYAEVKRGDEQRARILVLSTSVYPVLKTELSPQEEYALGEASAIAKRLLDAPPSAWPEGQPNEELKLHLQALSERRVSLIRGSLRSYLQSEIDAEGGEASVTIGSGCEKGSYLDLHVDADGFAAYCPMDGWLLEVSNQGSKLLATETADSPVVSADSLRRLAAMAEALLRVRDEIPAQVVETLQRSVAFFTRRELPPPTIVPELPKPWWCQESLIERDQEWALEAEVET